MFEVPDAPQVRHDLLQVLREDAGHQGAHRHGRLPGLAGRPAQPPDRRLGRAALGGELGCHGRLDRSSPSRSGTGRIMSCLRSPRESLLSEAEQGRPKSRWRVARTSAPNSALKARTCMHVGATAAHDREEADSKRLPREQNAPVPPTCMQVRALSANVGEESTPKLFKGFVHIAEAQSSSEFFTSAGCSCDPLLAAPARMPHGHFST